MKSDRKFFLFSSIFPFISFLIIAGIVVSLAYTSAPIFLRDGFKFVFSAAWNPPKEEYGVLPALIGTLITSGLAIAVAMPLAVSLAVFSVELVPPKLKDLVNSLSDLMASLPTVIYGLWGLYVLAPILHRYVMLPLHQHLGFIPLFSTKPSLTNLFTAGILLAIMIVPFASSVIREAYAATPYTLKEAAYSIGSTRWEVIRLTLGYIKSAIFAGMILAFGRAVGETIAVAMVVGNTPTLPRSLFDMGYTVSSLIANQFPNAEAYDYMVPALFGGALLLFFIGLAINVLGLRLARRMVPRA